MRVVRSLTRPLAAVAVAAAVVAIAPIALAGNVGYVVTHGVSMQPVYRGGDLVVVKRASRYDVGDVVAYRSRTLAGQTVLHRVIAREGSRYVFKGDNNDWTDRDRPTRSELIGKMWLHVPGGGRVLDRVRSFRALLAAVAFLGIAAFGPQRRRSRSRRRPVVPGEVVPSAAPRSPVPAAASADAPADAPVPAAAGVTATAAAAVTEPPALDRAPTAPGGPRPPLRRPLPITRAGRAAAAVGAIALVAVLLAGVAWSRPTTEVRARTLAYTQTVRLSYAGTARGDAYDGGRVRTGDPAFLQLVDRLQFTATYTFSSSDPVVVAGTGRLAATVRAANGWHRVIPLGAPLVTAGNPATVRATLDLAQLRVALAAVEQTSGVKSGSYTVELTPTFTARGTLAGGAVRASSTPAFAFTLDRDQLRPDRSAIESPSAGSSSGGSTARFTDERVASVRRFVEAPRRLHALGRSVDVADARTASAALLAATLLAALGLATAYRRVWADPAARALALGQHRVVDARAVDLHDHPVVDVDSVHELVHVATDHQAPVIRLAGDASATYLVDTGTSLYRCVVAEVPGRASREASPTPARRPRLRPPVVQGSNR